MNKGGLPMPELKLGLAKADGSFYDPKTNVYITPTNPVEVVQYDALTDLSGLAHAVFAFKPVLRLYEGQFPQAVVDAYKAKFDFAKKDIIGRVDQINGKSPATVNDTNSKKVVAGDAPITVKDKDRITAKNEGEAELLNQEELDLNAQNAENPDQSEEVAASTKKRAAKQ
jgi:hypothetical protein